jgi:hypothetical protein
LLSDPSTILFLIALFIALLMIGIKKRGENKDNRDISEKQYSKFWYSSVSVMLIIIIVPTILYKFDYLFFETVDKSLVPIKAEAYVHKKRTSNYKSIQNLKTMVMNYKIGNKEYTKQFSTFPDRYYSEKPITIKVFYNPKDIEDIRFSNYNQDNFIYQNLLSLFIAQVIAGFILLGLLLLGPPKKEGLKIYKCD